MQTDYRSFMATLLCLVFASTLWLSAQAAEEAAAAEEKPPPEPITTDDPTIPIDQLQLLVKPLTKDELLVEADAWQKLLKAKVEEVSAAEIAVKQKNAAIQKAEEVKTSIENAKEALDDVKDAAQLAQTENTEDAAKDTADAAQKADEAVKQAAENAEEAIISAKKIEQSESVRKAVEATNIDEPTGTSTATAQQATEAADEAKQAVAEVKDIAQEAVIAAEQDEPGESARKVAETSEAVDEAKGALNTTEESVSETVTEAIIEATESGASETKLDQTSQAVDTIAATEADDKSAILDEVAQLRDERTGLIDRLGVVLDELNTKLGMTPEGQDNEVVVPYRLYSSSVGGLKVDVSDTEAAWATLSGWVQSDEGGIRWVKNIAIFLATVIVFWLLGLILSKVAAKAFGLAKSTSILLRNFVVHSIRRIMVIIGIIIGLSALEVNIGPLLAVIGAAGFVVAFALQNTLSNFASGIMIMFYKPFDVGDVVDVAGLIGVVQSMNLVTTTITTGDNKVMIVPNSAIWGNTITNITGSRERRVDMVFGIGYGDDIAHAKQVLEEVVTAHPLVLKEPAPMIQVNELAESSVNFICRPWAKTEDYWSVYWDITRSVKERFDAEGISIPFPQRDLHIIRDSAENTSSEPSQQKPLQTASNAPLRENLEVVGEDTVKGEE